MAEENADIQVKPDSAAGTDSPPGTEPSKKLNIERGAILGLSCMLLAFTLGIFLSNEPLYTYMSMASFVIVFFGTCGAVMFSVKAKVFFNALTNIKHVFQKSNLDMPEIIEQCIKLADKARKAGFLALEDEHYDNEFIGRAVNLILDGYDSDAVDVMLSKDIYYERERNQQSVRVLETFAEIAPALGMIGTLIGLIAMLQNMDTPDSIGPSMALALITTLYGAIFANCFATPMARKIDDYSNEVLLSQCLIKDAIIHIMNRENPRMVFEYLQTYIETYKRKTHEDLRRMVSGA